MCITGKVSANCLKLNLVAIVLVFLGTDARAKTVFAVTSEEIALCNGIGETVSAFSMKRRQGVSDVEIRQAIRDSGVSIETASVFEKLIFGVQTTDPNQMQAITGSLCILDRLQPIEIK